jgi:hypothetical protein
VVEGLDGFIDRLWLLCAEGELLQEQAKAVKEAAVYVSMLRRVGKGHGTWNFDRYIREDATPVPA